MSRGTSVLFLGMVFGLLLSGGVQNVLTAQDDDSFKVGVVDIREVYQSYERADAFTKKIQKKKQEAERKIQETNDKIEQVKEELGELEPLSDLWKEKAREFYQLKSERKMLEDLWKQDTKKLLGETSAQIYQTISDVVSSYGEENNFDLILKTNKQPIGQRQAADINQQIATRSVLHFKNEMDLTDKIITILNERYQENQSGEDTSGQ